MNPFIKDRKQVSIFITAGYPKVNSLPEQLLFLQHQGVDFIEIGIPFSDPMADGPVIQESSSLALQNGMTLSLLFEQIASVQALLTIPIVLMGYLNPILQFGLEKFLTQCLEVGISGLILPDLSLELYQIHYQESFASSIPLIFLITPQTEDERVMAIAEACTNSFVYLIGNNGITGSSYAFSDRLLNRYRQLKSLCGETPLFLGFGIDNAEKKRQAFLHCDGAIIGTAYLKALALNDARQFLKKLLHSEKDG